MKRAENKSACPINYTLEIFGDTWSLLIMRDMAALGKQTFGEFLESPERISPSVLADRLAHLVRHDIIAKHPDPTDRRKPIYKFTNEGLDTLPIIYEFAWFGSHHSADPQAPPAWFASMKHDRGVVLKAWREALRAGSSFVNGPDSAAKKLKL